MKTPLILLGTDQKQYVLILVKDVNTGAFLKPNAMFLTTKENAELGQISSDKVFSAIRSPELFQLAQDYTSRPIEDWDLGGTVFIANFEPSDLQEDSPI